MKILGRQKPRLSLLHYVLVIAWLVFTLSLTGWWVAFGLKQLDLLILLQHDRTSELVRYQKMLLWEGGALVFVVLMGAVGLLAALYREMRASKRTNEFFAAFTHEIRTPLAAMQLQAEVISERLEKVQDDGGAGPVLGIQELLLRFQRETTRLARQLENALALVESDGQRWYCEDLDLAEIFDAAVARFPDVVIRVVGRAEVVADRRALGIIFDNVFQNSIQHGQATEITVGVERAERYVTIRISDNGKGFSGNAEDLGARFVRHTSTSGSGIGLYLVKKLVTALRGRVELTSRPEGFEVVVSLPSRRIDA